MVHPVKSDGVGVYSHPAGEAILSSLPPEETPRTERARPLIREGLELVAALPVIERWNTNFLPTAASIEHERVLSLIRDFSNARCRSCDSAVAESLADEHRPEAERVFRLIDDSARTFGGLKAQIAKRLRRRLAKSDPVAGAPARRRAEDALSESLRLGTAVLLGLHERDQPASALRPWPIQSARSIACLIQRTP